MNRMVMGATLAVTIGACSQPPPVPFAVEDAGSESGEPVIAEDAASNDAAGDAAGEVDTDADIQADGPFEADTCRFPPRAWDCASEEGKCPTDSGVYTYFCDGCETPPSAAGSCSFADPYSSGSIWCCSSPSCSRTPSQDSNCAPGTIARWCTTSAATGEFLQPIPADCSPLWAGYVCCSN